MLREIYVLREQTVLYWIQYGTAITWESLSPMLSSFMELLQNSVEEKMYQSTIVNYKISYMFHKPYNLLFLFISDITDDDKLIDKQIKELEKALPKFEGEMSKIGHKAQTLQQDIQEIQEK